jgi:hypothetical protein
MCYAESRMLVVDNLRIIVPVAVMQSLFLLNVIVQLFVSRFNVFASFILLCQQTLTFLGYYMVLNRESIIFDIFNFSVRH